MVENFGQNELVEKNGEKMTRIAIVFFVLSGVAIVGLVALSNWQIPAPTIAINKVIPNDKLAK